MTIDLFTCFREIWGLNLKFDLYLIFKGAYIGGGYILKDFCVRGACNRGTYIWDFTVLYIKRKTPY